MDCDKEKCEDFNKDYYQNCGSKVIFNIKDCPKRFDMTVVDNQNNIKPIVGEDIIKFKNELKYKSVEVNETDLLKCTTTECIHCINKPYDNCIDHIISYRIDNCDIIKSWIIVPRAKIAPDTLRYLVAAKILLAGMSESVRKRDNKGLIQIIKSVERESKAAMITNQDLVDVSGMTLNEIFLDKKD